MLRLVRTGLGLGSGGQIRLMQAVKKPLAVFDLFSVIRHLCLMFIIPWCRRHRWQLLLTARERRISRPMLIRAQACAAITFSVRFR